MRAYKFLDHGGRAVFSGLRWPLPRPGGEPGPWVEAGPGAENGAPVPCRAGIHASRPAAVGFWINEELWEMELGGDVVEAGTKLVAPRGRLVHRVAEWSAGVARELVGVTALRARDTAVAFCGNGSDDAVDAPGAPDALAALAACPAPGELGPAAIAAYRALPGGSEERTAVGFVVDAVHFLDAHVCHTPYVSACAAAHAASARTASRTHWRAALDAERAWQSAWISDRLGLA